MTMAAAYPDRALLVETPKMVYEESAATPRTIEDVRQSLQRDA
jgi:hypothetical protein